MKNRRPVYQDPLKADFGLFQLEPEIFQAKSRSVVQNLSERALPLLRLLFLQVSVVTSYSQLMLHFCIATRILPSLSSERESASLFLTITVTLRF